MSKHSKLFPFILVALLISRVLISRVEAHCPLCTAGIAAAAGSALALGVRTVTIGLFVGAFAVSTGMWFANSKGVTGVKKFLIALIAFLVTVVPLMSVMPEYIPVYISLAGDYGSLLNRTYLLSSFLGGSLIGAILLAATPWFNKKLTELVGKRIPFQGVVLTIISLTVVGVLLQVL
jgi:hypothetical protein